MGRSTALYTVDFLMSFFGDPLYWGLACAYRATVQYSQKTVAVAGTQTSSEDNMVEVGTQTTTTTVIAPLVKKQKTVDKESSGSISSISKRGGRGGKF